MNTYIANPDDNDDQPTESEQADVKEILRYIRIVRSHGGWGRVVVSMKAGELVEVETAYTEKLGARGQHK